MSMLSTFHSRKPNHEDTQKFDENEVYKIQVKLADPAAVQQFNADMAIIGIDMTRRTRVSLSVRKFCAAICRPAHQTLVVSV